MIATRLAAVFDIHSEDYIAFFRFTSIARAGLRRKGANTAEDNGIGRGRARHRAAHAMIIRITERELLAYSQELAIRLIHRRATAAQAGAHESVEYAFGGIGMEVRVNGVLLVACALIMAMMLPLTADTRVTQNLAAILLAEGRAQLAAVRDMVEHQTSGLLSVE